MEYLDYLQNTSWAMWLAEGDYSYPMLLCAHAIGMGIVVGTMFMLSFRVLGFARALPIAAFETMLRLSWFGFALNAASGFLLFSLDGKRLIETWSFQLKIALIVAGGISVWLMWRALRNEPGALAPGADVAGGTKALAVCTTLFWAGAVISGRLIAYTLPPL